MQPSAAARWRKERSAERRKKTIDQRVVGHERREAVQWVQWVQRGVTRVKRTPDAYDAEVAE